MPLRPTRPDTTPRGHRRSLRSLPAIVLACGLLVAACSKEDLDAKEVPPVTVIGTPLPTHASGADPAIGATPPTLSGSDFDGKDVTIDPGQGPMLLVFLAHWCPHCNAEVPRLVEWKDSGRVPDDLRVVGITTSVRPNAEHYPPSEWIDEVGWPWEVLADNEANDAAMAYGLRSFPYFVIVADGEVKSRFAGEIDADGLTTVVDQALAS